MPKKEKQAFVPAVACSSENTFSNPPLQKDKK